MNLDTSVLRVASLALRDLQRRRVVEVEVLRERLSRSIHDDVDLVLAPALSVLFLLGRVKYHAKNDALELVDKEAQHAA